MTVLIISAKSIFFYKNSNLNALCEFVSYDNQDNN